MNSRAATVAIPPFLLLGALLWHPPLPGRLPDNQGVAEAAAADPTRWGLAHLAAAIASAAIAIAFLAVRGYLRERGDGQRSAVGLGCVVFGSTLYAVLPGLEFAQLAAYKTGADMAATQEALTPWIVTVLISGSVPFLAGTILFAISVAKVAPLSRAKTTTVAVMLVIFGLARLVPVGAVQFYVQSAAALLALLPLAAAIAATPHARQSHRIPAASR